MEDGYDRLSSSSRKNRFAADTSRFAHSMNSMLFPVESMARYNYLQLFPTLI
jgi:hypothetical protein